MVERPDQIAENIMAIWIVSEKSGGPKCLHRILVPLMHQDLLKQ